MALPTPSTGPPSENFAALDQRLQSRDTKLVLFGKLDADGQRPRWDLWGPQAGVQGVELGPKVEGTMHNPFEQIMSEGAYEVGATYERVHWKKREISFRVCINVGQPDNIWRYRMIEQRWWSSWSATEDAFLGVFTRTHGWRFLRVRLAEEPKNGFDLDPAAFGNNYMEWDMTVVAVQPYWAKRLETARWDNDGEGDGGVPSTPWDQIEELIEDIAEGLFPGISNLIPGWHIGEGNIIIPNRGTEEAWPRFLVSGPGRCWIEDGPGGDMVALPMLVPADGYVLVDTDPRARTITGAKDPVDPLFFKIARNSQLLDFILHDITHSTLPVWRRFNGRFTTPWPARTINRIKVRHSNAGGQVTAFMPQRFSMAYG